MNIGFHSFRDRIRLHRIDCPTPFVLAYTVKFGSKNFLVGVTQYVDHTVENCKYRYDFHMKLTETEEFIIGSMNGNKVGYWIDSNLKTAIYSFLFGYMVNYSQRKE